MPSPVQSLASALPKVRLAAPTNVAAQQPTTSFRSLLSKTARPAASEAAPAEARKAEPRKAAAPTRGRRGDRNVESTAQDDPRAEEAEWDEDAKQAKRRPEPAEVTPEAEATIASATNAQDDGSVDPDASSDADEQAAAYAAVAAQMPCGAVEPDAAFTVAEEAVAGRGPIAPLNAQAVGKAEPGAEVASDGEGELAGAAEAGFALPAELSADADQDAAQEEAPAPPRPAIPTRKGPGLGAPPVAKRSAGEGEDAIATTAGANPNAVGAAAAGGVAPLDPALTAEAALAVADAPKDGRAATSGAGRADGSSPAIPAPDVSAKATAVPRHAAAPPASEVPPEARFAELNHDKVITGVRAELMPNGGSMQIRLDPPELGDLIVSIQIRDGVTTAAFQTSNDRASSLLSHSLTDLRASLEAQGVSVDRLHVQQTSKDSGDAAASNQQGGSSGQPTLEEREAGRREQQRKDMVQRMWQKLMGGGDPLDMVA